MNAFNSKLYRRDALLLCISFLLIYTMVPIAGGIDLALMQRWISPSGDFIYRNDPLLVKWNHEIFKQAMIGLYASFLVLFLLSFKISKLKPLRFEFGASFLLAALSTALIGLIKSQSRHDCPWNMLQSTAPNWVWDLSATQGHCFPGGHASTGFALMGAYFVFRIRHQRWAYVFLFVSLICGILMSLGQMMRGAHFLSHNLWTTWIIYIFNTLILLIYFKVLEFKEHITHNT